MKEQVLKIVKNALGNAEDNFYRAKLQFGKMNDEQLSKEDGQSGQTCKEVFLQYSSRVSEIKACVEWVESIV